MELESWKVELNYAYLCGFYTLIQEAKKKGLTMEELSKIVLSKMNKWGKLSKFLSIPKISNVKINIEGETNVMRDLKDAINKFKETV